MPSYNGSYLHVYSNCKFHINLGYFFCTLDYCLYIYFQLRDCNAMPRNSICLYRLGCGSKEKFRVIFLWTILVFFWFYIQELLSSNWNVPICDSVYLRLLVFLTFKQIIGPQSCLQKFLPSNDISLRIYSFRRFNIMHFMDFTIILIIASFSFKKKINLFRSSNKCLLRLLHKMFEMLHSLFLKIRSIYIKKCFYYDGDHGRRILFVGSSSLLFDFEINEDLCHNAWSWPLDNVLRQAIDHNSLYNFRIFDDNSNWLFFWKYL